MLTKEGWTLPASWIMLKKDILSVSEGRNKAGFIPISSVLHYRLWKLRRACEEQWWSYEVATGYRLRQNDVRATCRWVNRRLVHLLVKRPLYWILQRTLPWTWTETVAIFSLEMGALSPLVERIICSHASINAGHLETGQVNAWRIYTIFRGDRALSEAPILLVILQGSCCWDSDSKCRRLKQRA